MLLLRKSSVRTPLSPKVTHANTVLLRLYCKYIILSFPFLHLKPSHISFLAPLQIHGLLFLNCYMHICMYLCIPKYNLLCLYGVTCIYVQKADHQILEKWLVYLSLDKTTSPTLSLPSYLQFFLEGWDLLGFPTCICILACLLFLSLFNSCLGNNVVNTSQVQHI